MATVRDRDRKKRQHGKKTGTSLRQVRANCVDQFVIVKGEEIGDQKEGVLRNESGQQ